MSAGAGRRPVAIWLAGMVSLAALAIGGFFLLTLVRYGLMSPLESLFALIIPLIAIVAVVSLRWWGLMVAALFALWVLATSPLASSQAVAVLVGYYAPLALVAFVHHKQFKWI